jgi:xylan 1,4-beta-xylosidase
MFSQMRGKRLGVESDHAIPLQDILKSGVRGQADVSGLASLDKNQICVMLWHYHDDDVPGPAAEITLNLTGIGGAKHGAKLEHFRIDEEHSNAFAAWKKMGSPQQPTPEQYAQLEKAGRLATLDVAEKLEIKNGSATVRTELPRQAVSLLKLSW